MSVVDVAIMWVMGFFFEGFVAIGREGALVYVWELSFLLLWLERGRESYREICHNFLHVLRDMGLENQTNVVGRRVSWMAFSYI